MPFGMRTAIFRVELGPLGAVEALRLEVLPPVATSSRRNLMVLVLAKGELEALLTWDENDGVITHDTGHGMGKRRG